MLQEQNSLALKENLYMQEWNNDLKTIFEASPKPHLDTLIGTSGAFLFCSANLLLWKLFQADLSYLLLGGLSASSLFSFGQLKGLMAQ